MQDNTSLVTMARYGKWANQVSYTAIAALSETDVYAERPMLFGSIANLLSHINAMADVWKCHLEGRPHGYTRRAPNKTNSSIVELSVQQNQNYEWYVRYACALDLNLYAEKVDFEFIGGGSGRMSREEIILHVINHCSYHRGHIEGVFYQLSVEPPTTDLTAYLNDIYDARGSGQ
ncbi:MAG: DinB family protein [Pseudomonadales bacterium]